MKAINDYVQMLMEIDLQEGYIQISPEEWDDLMEGEEYNGMVVKDYGTVRVTIEVED